MNMSDASIPAAVQTAADSLGRSLARAEPVAAYRQAEARLTADAQASAVLQELMDVQADLRRRQGDVTEDDIDRFRSLRREVDANATIVAYVESQDAATAFVREVNQDLSRLLGFDFSALARRGGCCS